MKLADFFVHETEPTQPEHSFVKKKKKKKIEISQRSVPPLCKICENLILLAMFFFVIYPKLELIWSNFDVKAKMSQWSSIKHLNHNTKYHSAGLTLISSHSHTL